MEHAVSQREVTFVLVTRDSLEGTATKVKIDFISTKHLDNIIVITLAKSWRYFEYILIF